VTGAFKVAGAETLRKRFARLAARIDLRGALRAEAEAVAADARARLAAGRSEGPGTLAGSVKIVDLSRGTKVAFSVGMDEPAGFFVEFGTAKRAAIPWLSPVFHARLPGIKQAITKLVTMTVKARPNGV
jgi:hypothetical protein